MLLPPGLDPYKTTIGSMRDASKQYADIQQQRLANTKAEQALPFNIPMLKEILLREQLGNQETQATLPYKGPQAQAKLQADQMQNQMTQEGMPFNLPMLKANLLKAQLGNQQTQQDIQFAPQEQMLKQAMLKLQQARLNNELNPRNFDPLRDIKGDAQQIAAIKWFRENGREAEADMLESKLKQSNRGLFSTLPADEKNRQAARIAALKIPLSEGVAFFNEGGDIEELARQRGMSEEEIEKAGFNQAPTGPVRTRAQNQLVANMGLKYLNNEIDTMIGPYLNDLNFFKGKSTKQVMDFISGQSEDPKVRGAFLAASKLIPEGAALRGRSLGANLGIEALHHLESSIPYSIRSVEELEDKESVQEAIRIFNKVNTNLSAIETDVAKNPYRYEQMLQPILEEINLEGLINKNAGKSSSKKSASGQIDLDSMSIEEMEAYERKLMEGK